MWFRIYVSVFVNYEYKLQDKTKMAHYMDSSGLETLHKSTVPVSKKYLKHISNHGNRTHVHVMVNNEQKMLGITYNYQLNRFLIIHTCD